MSIWINLGGIRQRIPIISSTLGVNVNTRYLGYSNINSNDYIAGWGLKNNTSRMRKKSAQLAVPYLHLEDGFIGYLGHPADNGHAVSLVADEFGIYYDARMPSGLERCVNELIAHDDDSPLLTRASLLIDSVVEHGVTKYNCYNNKDLPSGLAARLASDQCETVLIIDQVAGDLSIKYSLASEQSFVDMVAQAKADFPNARLLLRTHPDTRVGKKRGVLARLELPELEVISEACHPHALIKQVDAVYTVSSQMGFEALLLGKPVYCFGLPFYAGWGLTHDTHSLDDDNRRGNATLEQLVAAALILYPKYYDPVLQCKCEVEDIVRLVALQYEQAAPYKTVYMLGFSLWKRAFMQRFCKHLATKLHFVQKLPKQLACDEAVLVWGGKYPELNDCIRVEDGFIRSSGLGSNLNRPSSLSIDHHGMFCDSRTPSDLELLLNDIQLTPTQASRAKSLLTILRERRVSKYNVGNRGEFVAPDDGKALILVVGQVDGDASIVNGSPVIKSNEALLWAVRESLPNAHILYKPHPDYLASINLAGSASIILAG